MIEKANIYFSNHLDNEYWQNAELERKNSALAMAQCQVEAVANCVVDNAVFEQAIYLLRNHASMSSGRVVSSQSLEGLGSQSFAYLSDENGLCQMAKLFIKNAPRKQVEIKRG